MKFARPRRFTHAFVKMIRADAFERLRHLLQWQQAAFRDRDCNHGGGHDSECQDASKDGSKLRGKLLVARPVLSELDEVGSAIGLFKCCDQRK